MQINTRRTVLLAIAALVAVATAAYPARTQINPPRYPPKVTWYYEAKAWSSAPLESANTANPANPRVTYRFQVTDLTLLLEDEGKNGWELASTPLADPDFTERSVSSGKRTIWVLFKRTDAP